MRKSLIYIMFLICGILSAQEKDRELLKGNKQFVEKKYSEAEADYRISQTKQASKPIAAYNLGNSIYKQNKISESIHAFKNAIKSSKKYSEKHLAYHNLGNAYMQEKKYTEAVEAYKNALRNNPNDEETRYNYALAKEYLKNNPPPKDDKKDKKDDKKEKDKKDQKDKEKDKKKDDKGEQNKETEGDKKEEENKDGKPKEKPKQQGGGISKERLENLLEAVNNEEKKIQEKLNAKKVKGKPVHTEKDW